MMGSGKTTIGRLLAQKTGWPLFDNDEVLQGLFGMNPRQLFDNRGEAEMRAAEDAALAYSLRQPGPSIIDAAAGTILSPDSRAALGDAAVVWLRASPETLFRRATEAEAVHRPWIDRGEPWLAATHAQRGPLYASVADVVLDTDDRDPDELATQLAEGIPELCRLDASSIRGP